MRHDLNGWTWLAIGLLAAGASGGTIIGADSAVPTNPRQEYPRYVGFRPADGQVVTVNPPRFGWPYLPGIVFQTSSVPATQHFTLQIAATPDFARPAVEVADTACNFYNFLPPLRGARKWYWRVGYNVGDDGATWSDVRSFTLADDAVEWDRSRFGELLDSLTGHPRLLFDPTRRAELAALRERDARSAEIYDLILATAERALGRDWYRDFPADDAAPRNYMQIGRELVFVAFAYLLTGDEKYVGFRSRLLQMAAYPPGGRSSPEGMVKGGDKWPTHLTEYFGLFYDWFYDDLTAAERAVVRGSLEWRVEHTLNSFAWRRNAGQKIGRGSIAVLCSSHPYENLMVTLPGALAIADESKIAREALEIGLHYLVGITNGFGADEAWNEGPGYGNGKMKWLMDATWYLQTALPALQLGRNPAYSAYADFFARLTPVGAQHSSFGNRGYNESDWSASRLNNFRRVAMLSGDGRAMANWFATRRRMAAIGRGRIATFSPWIDYVLPLYAAEPEPVVEDHPVRLFGVEGWVTASSAPPSDDAAQRNAVSMSFACRPRGGYSHAFRSENGFDLHAYGQTISVGGGTTSNQSYFANHTMSHNTILVNGREQLAARSATVRSCGRIIAFREGERFTYWAGDATAAYGPATGLARFIRHVLFVDGSWFAIHDDLALADDQEPGTFQWLYHVTPDVPFELDRGTMRLSYAVDDVAVVVQHLQNVADLTCEDRPGAHGMVNPLTDEDLTTMDKWLKGNKTKRVPKPLAAHHFWFSHRTPRKTMAFTVVIVPYRQGEDPPTIEAVGADGLAVTFRGRRTTVAFAPDPAADIAVDIAAIGQLAGSP